MKRNLLILTLLGMGLYAFTQPVARTDTGTVNCAAYKILFPENYQNKLVMLAHGYEFMGSPSAITQALERNPRRAEELARQFNLKVEDIAFTLFFGEGVLRDVALK